MSQSIETTIAKAECLEIVTRFFGHYDRREYPPMYALMAPDGSWHRPDGLVRVGPELQAAMAKRPTTLTVVHLITNLAAEATAADSISVRGLMTVFRDDKGNMGLGKLGGANSIIDFTMGFKKLGADWRIHTINVTYLFKA